MKLRVNGNSIRFRLTPEEVNQLCHKGEVTEKCFIGDHSLNYTLAKTHEAHYSARMTNGKIQVNIPKGLLVGWEENDKVGFEHKDENGLFIKIEKDFQCMQPRKNEKEEHLYPNPAKN